MKGGLNSWIITLLVSPTLSNKPRKTHENSRNNIFPIADKLWSIAAGFCSAASTYADGTLSIHHFDGTWQDSREKRRHQITTQINRFFGVKIGSIIDRDIGNIEYFVQAAKGKLKRR